MTQRVQLDRFILVLKGSQKQCNFTIPVPCLNWYLLGWSWTLDSVLLLWIVSNKPVCKPVSFIPNLTFVKGCNRTRGTSFPSVLC